MDDLNLSFDPAPLVEPVERAVSALQALKRTLHEVGDSPVTRIKGVKAALIDPISDAVKLAGGEVEKLAGVLTTSLKSAEVAAAAGGKRVGDAVARGMSEGTGRAKSLVRQQVAELQQEYERALSSGWKLKAPVLLDLKAQGVALAPQDRIKAAAYVDSAKASAGVLATARAAEVEASTLRDKALQDDLAGYQQMLKLKVAADATAVAQRESLASKAQQDDLAGYQQMLKLKVAADSVAHAQREELNRRAQLDDLAGYQQMLKLKVGADTTAVAQREALNHKAQLDDLLGYQQMLQLKLAADAKAGAQREALNLRAQQDDLAGYQQMLRLRLGADAAAMAQREAMNRKALQDDLAGYRQMLNLKVAAEASARKAVQSQVDLNAQFGGLSARGQLTRATRVAGVLGSGMSDAEAVAKFGSEAVGAARNLDGLRKKVQDLNDAGGGLPNLSGNMRDLHSAARGVASGFNAMWLTWGQIGPLLAGAAISNAFVQAVREGAKFEHTLEVIGQLGGASAEELQKLNQAAMEVARSGPFGPNEVAGALKTLSLAGLDAKQQLEALKPVLNFAVAGEMPLEKAAESLTAISTAFGYSATGFSAVGDVIAKAAAISMSSVESMTESFRQASTVAQLFGVSVEDTATSLALLSQVGIKGTAAGTAVRNMYNELLGTSKRAREVLEKTLKIDVIDNATKAFKPLYQIISDASEALSKLDFKSQLNALQALGNERGLKAFAADLAAFQTAAKEAGADVPNQLAKIRQALEDAPGFAAQAAVGMSLTTLNQMKSVVSSLEAALIEAFQGMQPEVQAFSKTLRDAFNSDGFKEGLRGVLGTLADLAMLLVENIEVLKAVAAGYVIGKTAVLAYGAAASLAAGASGALSTGLTAVGMSARSAAVGARLLQVSLGPISAIVAAVGAAYLLFADQTKSALDQSREATKAHFEATVDGLKKEEERLNAQMQARAEGMSGQLANYAVEANLAESRLRALHEEALAAERAKGAQLQLARARIAGTPYAQTAQGASALAKIDADIAAEGSRVAGVARNQERQMEELRAGFARVKALAIKDAREAAEAARASRNPITGSGKYTPTETGHQPQDNILQQLERRLSRELALIQSTNNNAKQLLDARHQAELLSEADYQAQLFRIAQDSEARALDEIRNKTTEYEAAYKERFAKARSAQEQENLKQARDTFLEGAKDQAAKIRDDALTRLKIGLISVQGGYEKAAKAEAEFWRKDAGEIEKIRSADELARQFAFINESVFSSDAAYKAYAETTASETLRMGQHLDEFERQYQKAEAAADAFLRANVAAIMAGDAAAVNQLNTLEDAANRYKKALESIKANAPQAIAERAELAFDRMRRDQANKLTASLADAVETALFDGGKTGGKKLRQLVEDELLLRKPFRMMLQAVIQPLVGNMLGTGGSTGGSAGAGGSALSTANSLYSAYNTGSSLMTVGSQVAAGTMSMANAGATMFANATGAGLDGLLMANGAYGTAAAGSASSMMASMAAAGPYVLAAIVIANALGLFKKTKKVGGGLGGTVGDQTDLFSYDLMRKSGSLVSGPKYSVRQNAMDDATAQAIQSSVGSLLTQARGQAGALGLGGNLSSFTGRLGSDLIHPDTGGYGIKLDGLSAEEAQAKVQAEIQKLYDTMAEQALAGAWQQFVKVGETAGATLTRLAGSLTGVNGMLDTLGVRLYDASLAGADMASKLVDVFGGLDNLSQLTQSYYQDFYTESERTATTTRQLSKAMAELGLGALPQTREEFRRLVEAQDLTTDAGRKNYAALLGISGAFASITEASAGATSALRQLRSETAGLRVAALQALGLVAEAAALQRQIDTAGMTDAEVAVYDYNAALKAQTEAVVAAERAVTDARSELINVYERESGVLESTVERFRTLSDGLREFRDSLQMGDLSTLSPSEKYAKALGDFQSTYALAANGDETALGKLQGVSQTLLESSRAVYASGAQYTSDFAMVQQALGDAAISADAGADVASLQLDALKAQLTTLGAIEANTLTMAEALAAYQAALGGQALAQGTLSSTLGLPSFDVGTNYVPSDMVAQIHRGERIIPAADNRALMSRLDQSGGDDAYTAALVAEIRVLGERIVQLEQTVARGAAMNVEATERNTREISGTVRDSASQGAHRARLERKAELT